jgi:hypothetical protein
VLLTRRTVHGSRRFTDRYFPLLVGCVALVTAGTAVALDVGQTDGWAAFGGLWALVALCVACLFVEVWDRASSRGAYLGGVAMTTAAAGALAFL